MEYPDGYSTAIRCVVRKVATMEGKLVCFGDDYSAEMLFPDGWTCI